MASQLIASQGKVKELRVVELGSRHGPPTDQIDVEVVAESIRSPTGDWVSSFRTTRIGLFVRACWICCVMHFS